jgi:GT2 family glycosyltransferase
MFLDSDARLTPNALVRLVDVLERNPSIGLVGPRLLFADGSHQPSGRRFPPVRCPSSVGRP